MDVKIELHEEEVMTKDHDRWDEFIERLEGSEGCNFRKNEDGKTTWDCGGGEDKTFAINILKLMSNINIAKSIKYFEEQGGYCDCEIVLNPGKKLKKYVEVK